MVVMMPGRDEVAVKGVVTSGPGSCGATGGAWRRPVRARPGGPCGWPRRDPRARRSGSSSMPWRSRRSGRCSLVVTFRMGRRCAPLVRLGVHLWVRVAPGSMSRVMSSPMSMLPASSPTLREARSRFASASRARETRPCVIPGVGDRSVEANRERDGVRDAPDGEISEDLPLTSRPFDDAGAAVGHRRVGIAG